MQDLLVGRIGEQSFAVPSDMVQESIPLTTLPRPLQRGRPDLVAGVVDGKATLFCDLSSRLGLDGTLRAPAAGVVTNRDAQIAGLAFQSAPVGVSVADDDILPVSSSVESPLCDRYALVEGTPVPLITRRFLDALSEATVSLGSLMLEYSSTNATASDAGWREIRVGGRALAIAAEQVLDETELSSRIVPTPYLGNGVTGLIAHEGEMVPLVDLSQTLGLDERTDGTRFTVCLNGGARVLYLVDEVRGTVAGDAVRVSLPPLLRSPGIDAALLTECTVLPIVEPSVLTQSDRSRAEEYELSSDFNERIFRTDVSVVEFSYGDATYAVPESEVRDLDVDQPAVSLESTDSLVVEVIRLEDEPIPMLNLGRYLGHSAAPRGSSRLLVVQNGTFQAAFAPEQQAGKRIIPRDRQRRLPVGLPHEVVYGCYVEGDDVRLILNLAGIAQHANEPAVRDAFPGVRAPANTTAAADATTPVPPPAATVADTDRDVPDASNADPNANANVTAGSEEPIAETALHDETGPAESPEEATVDPPEVLDVPGRDEARTPDLAEHEIPDAAEPEQRPVRRTRRRLLVPVALALLAGAALFFALRNEPIVRPDAAEGAAAEQADHHPATAEPTAPQRENVTEIEDTVVESVYFGPDSARLDPEARNMLSRVAGGVSHRNCELEIVGHTADVGSEASSRELSLERAHQVADYLLPRLTVQPDSVVVRGAGATEPAATNATPAGRSLNRRVVVVVTATSGESRTTP